MLNETLKLIVGCNDWCVYTFVHVLCEWVRVWCVVYLMGRVQFYKCCLSILPQHPNDISPTPHTPHTHTPHLFTHSLSHTHTHTHTGVPLEPLSQVCVRSSWMKKHLMVY